MKLWSLVLLAVAALAAVAGFAGLRDDNQGILVARVIFGIVLLLFANSLLSDRHDPHPDERRDH